MEKQTENIEAKLDEEVAAQLNIDQATASLESNLKEMQEQREGLVSKISLMKEELSNWKKEYNEQLQTYKNDLAGMRNSLKSEVDTLTSQFDELRSTIKQQLDQTAAIAEMDFTAPETADKLQGLIAASDD